MLGGTWTQADCRVGTGGKQVRVPHLTSLHIRSLSDAMSVSLNTSHQAAPHSGRGIWALNYPCHCIVNNHPRSTVINSQLAYNYLRPEAAYGLVRTY